MTGKKNKESYNNVEEELNQRKHATQFYDPLYSQSMVFVVLNIQINRADRKIQKQTYTYSPTDFLQKLQFF